MGVSFSAVNCCAKIYTNFYNRLMKEESCVGKIPETSQNKSTADP